MEHTKLPWAAYRDHPDTKDICYIRPKGSPHGALDEVAVLYDANMDENANLIVTAANYHDRLVEQLRALEWAGVADIGCAGLVCGACPSCGNVDPDANQEDSFIESAIGHKADCKLAALLKDVKQLNHLSKPLLEYDSIGR